MRKHKKKFPVGKMAKVLKVSCAGYYKYINRKESLWEKENRELTQAIKVIHEESRGVYGSPRVHAILSKQGKKCSRKRVARIMQENGIQAKTKRKWKTTTKATKDPAKVAPNLVNQNFTVKEKNRVWVSDITYIETGEGWLYLAATMDLYSRMLVGLSMSSRMNADLVERSLQQAIFHRAPQKGVIAHSDRGSQYTSDQYKKHALKHGIRLSMSSTGNCFDNAAMESFFHTLKTEHVFFQKFSTRAEAIQSIFEYVEVFYNRQRLHSTLGYLSPYEFEEQQSLKEKEKPENGVLLPSSTKEVNLPICFV